MFVFALPQPELPPQLFFNTFFNVLIGYFSLLFFRADPFSRFSWTGWIGPTVGGVGQGLVGAGPIDAGSRGVLLRLASGEEPSWGDGACPMSAAPACPRHQLVRWTSLSSNGLRSGLQALNQQVPKGEAT